MHCGSGRQSASSALLRRGAWLNSSMNKIMKETGLTLASVFELTTSGTVAKKPNSDDAIVNAPRLRRKDSEEAR